jgi:phosphoglycolate phosphatase
MPAGGPERSRRFELVVFDWDGTLSDSLGHIVDSMQAAIRALGLAPRAESQIRGMIGLGLEQVTARLYPELGARNRRALEEKYRYCFTSRPGPAIPLYPGVADTIAELHAGGYLIAVATGKSRRGLDRALRESGLDIYVHASRCADETFSKPHPQMLRELMDYLDIEASRTLMIGDTEHDLQMALNAGVAAAAVSHGAQEAARLLEFAPLVCFSGLPELPDWLARQNGAGYTGTKS